MLIDFNQLKELTISGMNQGTGEMSARMYADSHGKIIYSRIHAGGSIGNHSHPASDDINYVLSGTGVAVCDGREEQLRPGTCHVCRQGSEHSIENTGAEDLVLVTVVAERP